MQRKFKETLKSSSQNPTAECFYVKTGYKLAVKLNSVIG